MLTQFITDESDRNVLGDLVRLNAEHPYTYQLSFKRDVTGKYYWEEIGRLDCIPALLASVPITHVMLRHRSLLVGFTMPADPGMYSIKDATAYVEHSLSDRHGNVQHITVSGETLEVANLLFDLVLARKIKPVKPKKERTTGRVKLWFRQTLETLQRHASYLYLKRN